MIADLIENKILLDIKAKDYLDAIEELTDLIAKESNINKKKLIDDLMEREKLGSTGIGNGIAIPHTNKTDALEGVVVAFGRSKKGIDFNTLDDKPAHLFFLIAAPRNHLDEYYNVLARVSRLLKDEQFRKELREAKSIEEIIALFREKEE